nr:ATP synthase subunit I [Idiomarina sp. ATCH4]
MAGKIVSTQFIVVLIAALVTIMISNTQSALGILCGGLTAVIPNVLFALIAFRYAGARANQKVVQSFFLGEGVKLLLTALLLIVALLMTNLYPVWLLVGFVIAVTMQWIAPVLFLKST